MSGASKRAEPELHTPGPWRFEPQTEYDFPYVLIGEDAIAVQSDDATADANARLIAAAPELLAALKRCRFDSLNMSLADLAFCRAAIAKATGTTP